MTKLLLTLVALSTLLTGCGGGTAPVSPAVVVAVDQEILRIDVPAGLTYSPTISPGQY